MEASPTKQVRVLIVDDSALVREVLTEVLSMDPGIEVVGTAADAFAARDMIKACEPDVLTLDIEMPKMDGVTFLKNLMRLRPMPVVMVSSLTEQGAQVTLECLEVGAVDFVAKPKLNALMDMQSYAEKVADKVKGAAMAKVRPWRPPGSPRPTTSRTRATDIIAQERPLMPNQKLVAIAASTGGTEAIREILEEMPADAPPVVIAQHIPATFSGAFAKRVDRDCAMTVTEAVDGETILHGHAYIAPGDNHLVVVQKSGRYVCRVTDDPHVNRHRPSCDTLFFSVAQAVGANAVGAILTGMGKDGAEGLLELQSRGADTIAQDEASCVVWGMPGAAVHLGAADYVLPLARVASRIMKLVDTGSRTRPPHATTPR